MSAANLLGKLDELLLRPEHVEDLRRSGLSDETIMAAGFRSVDHDEARRLLGFDPKCGGWVIPYPHRNGLDDLIHFKPDVPYVGQDGKSRKYLFPKGSINRVYVPPMISMERYQSIQEPLFITEGEKKALKASQEGLVCIAIPGVWNWRYKDGIGDSRTIPDLFDVWLRGRTVHICFDSDAASKPGIAKAEFALAQRLRAAGAVVDAIRIPEGGA